MTLRWVPGWNGLTEPEAVSYVAAVEAADDQELEFGVARAINDFVLGCKQAGIWDAIKACCILAGARTTNGALVPLVGTAPTPNNFDLVGDTDYDRKTGLVGDGSTKYLDSNRASNSDPQNSRHASVYVSTKTGNGPFLGAISSGPIYTWMGPGNSPGNDGYVLNSETFTTTPRVTSLGFCGVSRPSSTNISYRFGGSTTQVSNTSAAHGIETIKVHKVNNINPGGSDYYGASRLAFYSIGESLDLAALDTRVSNLITAIGAAIP
jgi:hypothetical protein